MTSVPHELLSGAARSWPGKTAIVDGERRASWAALADRSSRLAGALRELGVRKGDVVGILAPDRLELVEHFWACARLGALRTGINFRYAPREMRHLIEDADIRVLLLDPSVVGSALDEVREAMDGNGRAVVGIGRDHGCDLDYDSLLAAEPEPAAELEPDDAFALSYTSGTTGLPKGAIFTQRSVLQSLTRTVLSVGLRHEDVWANPVPGPGAPVIFTAVGAANGMTVVLPDGRFRPGRFLDAIERERVTSTIVVPTMLAQLLDDDRLEQRDLSSLRLLCYGSSPATPALIRRAKALLGSELQQWYTCTELTACPAVILRDAEHVTALEGDESLLSSCGRPVSHVEVAVTEPDGTGLPAGEVGEVRVRSDTRFAGYLNRPEETGESILADGWLRTGDLGKFDAGGYLHLVDRSHFMIISGGYNVYPVVVEAVLADHPAVSEVAVIGLPHPDWGEVVAAVVEPVAGEAPDAAKLISYCRERVGAWEVPKLVDLVEELPKGATGKLDKRALKRRYEEHPELVPWSLEVA